MPARHSWAKRGAMEWTDALKVIGLVSVPYGGAITYLIGSLKLAREDLKSEQVEVRRLNAAWHAESEAAGKVLAQTTQALTAATDKVTDLTKRIAELATDLNDHGERGDEGSLRPGLGRR